MLGDSAMRAMTSMALNAMAGVVVSQAIAAGIAPSIGVASGGGPSAPATIVRRIGHGEKLANIIADGKSLTFATGNEHAVISLTTGERLLVSGGPKGITFEGMALRRIIGHTHPYHLPATGPSKADFNALKQLRQRNSYLLEHGILTKFGEP
jgi:hypothetical protein